MVKLINEEETSQPEQIVDLNPCVIKPLSESAAASPQKKKNKLPRMREFNLSFLLFCLLAIVRIPSCTVFIHLFIHSAAGSSGSFSVSVTHGGKKSVKFTHSEVKLRLNFRRAAVVFQTGASFGKKRPAKAKL